MKTLMCCALTLCLSTGVALGKKSTLIKGVTSFTQNEISSSVHGKKKAVLEGCGPIAAAMVLGYYQSERGFTNLLQRGFKGSGHPTKAIEKIYKKLKTKSAPGKKNKAAFTTPKSFHAGMKALTAGHKLEAKRMRNITSWKKRKQEIKAQLAKGNPVILLKWKEHEKGCIGSDSKGWNIVKNISYAHYYVAVGYMGDTVAVMPGWRDSSKSGSDSWKAYSQSKNKSARRTCTFAEIKKDNPGLFWYQKSSTAWCKKDSDCASKQWCNKGFLTVGKNKCQSQLKKKKKCSRKGQCASNKCSLFRCK
jgi:hypothetical protein